MVVRRRGSKPAGKDAGALLPYDSHDVMAAEISSTVQKGINDTELGIFKNCSFLKDRLETLSGIILSLEKDLAAPNLYNDLSGTEKLKIYTIYSSISMQMLEFLKDVHLLIADEVKFKRIQDLLAEAKNSINKEISPVMPPKMRQVLEAVRSLIADR